MGVTKDDVFANLTQESQNYINIYNGSYFNKTNVIQLGNTAGTVMADVDNAYYSISYRIIAVLFPLIIFIVGMLGNLLVIIVISRRRSMHTPTNCYLISLSVSDFLVLLSATLPSIPEPFFIKDQWPWGRAMCSILVFVSYLGADASALSITAFTFERYIAICQPIKSQAICTVRRAKRIIIALWSFSILYCTPWLGLTTLQYSENKTNGIYNVQVCTYLLERESYLWYYLADFVIFYVFPLLLSGVFYSFIIRILFLNTGLDHSGGNSNGKAQENTNRSRQTSKSRVQVIRMLIVIVVVFTFSWLPYRTVVVYNSLHPDAKFLNHWFWLFCRIMVYINSAMNPILYSLMSMKFRKAYQRILSCKPQFKRTSSCVLQTESTAENWTRISRRGHVENIYLMTGSPRRFVSNGVRRDKPGQDSKFSINVNVCGHTSDDSQL